MNLLEMNNLVTTSDIGRIMKEMETIRRIAESVKRYLVELGKEGIIVSMRLQELTKNLTKEREMILEDYFPSEANIVDESLRSMNFDSLLEISNILKTFFKEAQDKPISPNGKRLLNKTGINGESIELLLSKYKTLDKIFSLDKEELLQTFSEASYVNFLKQNLDHIKEKILIGKNL